MTTSDSRFVDGMPPPVNPALPFFAYGAFRPGELAFLRIKNYAIGIKRAVLKGALRIRDGLPIADVADSGSIDGFLIRLAEEKQIAAYRQISELEPQKQYRWEELQVDGSAANVLVGMSPKKGSLLLEEAWRGEDDPLFTAALDVVEETFAMNRSFAWDLKPLFRLEMAYLLLWSSVERYASLRYHLGSRAFEKIELVASEPAFQHALREYVSEERTVQRADAPTKTCKLDPSDPAKSIAYYYQLRSNLVHRGKAATNDHQRLVSSLDELLPIFRATLAAAFAESAAAIPS
jgi:hypothetical protein